MRRHLIHVQSNIIKATVNTILREWRDLWPGGLNEKDYSKLNLMAHCRHGTLGYNYAKCSGCGHREWYASSCGDRHCPNCLGSRQAKWAQNVCERLPDCPHFHVVFSLPCQVWQFFEDNYRIAAKVFFEAAAKTLKIFQQNNWGCHGGFFGVLHTWGSAMNWHPHLHCLVSGGGIDLKTGRWRKARPNYLFPVKAMMKVFKGLFIRGLEELDGCQEVIWPEGARTLEERRAWRQMLATRSWNIYSKETLGNTRAVVRYLARYTSRIAMSNQRILKVDEEKRTVTFSWKDYKDRGQHKERTLEGWKFIRSFVRHLVPEGFRRIRYYGWLARGKSPLRDVPGAPVETVGERAAEPNRPPCPACEATAWEYGAFYQANQDARRCVSTLPRFSLYAASAVP